MVNLRRMLSLKTLTIWTFVLLDTVLVLRIVLSSKWFQKKYPFPNFVHSPKFLKNSYPTDTFASSKSFVKIPRDLNTICSGDFCMESKSIDWHLVTFVISYPDNLSLRKVIRRTWGSYKYIEGGRLDVIFVIGMAEGKTQKLLDKEAETYQDLLQVNLPDYGNTTELVLAGMRWASDNLPGDYFYGATVDDAIVSVGEIQEIIDRYRNNVAIGILLNFPIICMFDSRSHYHPAVAEELSSQERKESLDYCSEDMYIMTVELASQLLKISHLRTQTVNFNIWITGILRGKLGKADGKIERVQPPAAIAWGFGEDPLTMKEMRRYVQKQLVTQLYDKSVCKCFEDIDEDD